MTNKSPLYRPLGILAGGLGIVQSVAYGALGILCILAYSEVFVLTRKVSQPSNLFWIYLYSYLSYASFSYGPDIKLSSVAVLAIAILYVTTSTIWLIISALFLKNVLDSKSSLTLPWIIITVIVSVLDFSAVVAFGVEYENFKAIFVSEYNAEHTLILLVPLTLMLVAARGFILWIINVALVTFFIWEQFFRKSCHKHGTFMTSNEFIPEIPRRLSMASVNSKENADTFSKGQKNPAYQPDILSAWSVQSPTIGDIKRGPWSFSDDKTLHLVDTTIGSSNVLPRVGRPVSTPVAPVSPLPIPHPDYSPPLGRPIKHEPNFYDIPLRPALKKPNSLGRTIL